MFEKYFKDDEIKNEYKKKFISLWPGWLGKENDHLLDEVTEADWSKFNSLIKIIFKHYRLQVVDFKKRRLINVKNIEDLLCDYEDSGNKNSNEFSIYIIPELDCVLSEDWDYTFILWYKGENAIKSLRPFIEKSGLFDFN
ncbi:hypothetical protein K0U91_06100 [Chryseobacterium chendengshani]|uniref:hypothetical protein n=1 Tax=Chryseobacterium sp. LJ668 TaxID=2864040 RepID=UPI001C6938A7|nr:hypothetical protein [Chryseobacterium sp. LJ668]MBW8522042.1 hypothetical protein [Chryseobacterium sp. LJ668]QYK17694.1 hypothetical protein K0U91_06100 [Chryseobacterium sp. LJ668]